MEKKAPKSATLCLGCPDNIKMFLPILLMVLLVPSAASAADSDTYEKFLQCLTNHSSTATGVAESNISSILYTRTNPSFPSVLQAYLRNARFNTSTILKPTMIVTPRAVSEVQAAVVCAKAMGVLLKIRSGGHDYDGVSYADADADARPFFILDMFNLRSIAVDIQNQTAWVQAGATLGELYYRISEKSKLHGFPAGICPTVAVGGHISGGGYGNMLRKYGLSVDNVVDGQVVDAKGRVLDRQGMGEDLFWAIRGGGGASFGVVLSYKVNLVPVPETVTVFRIERTKDRNENTTDLVYRWMNVADKIDDGLFIRVLLQPVSSKVNKGQRTVRATFISLFLGDADRLLSVMDTGFPELGIKKEDCLEMSWVESVVWWSNLDNGTSTDVLLDRQPGDPATFLKRKSDYLRTPMSKPGLESLWKKMVELGKTGLVLNPYGGAMSRVRSDATPFPHRAGNICKVQYSVNWDEGDGGEAASTRFMGQIRQLYDYTAPFFSKSPRAAYLNYRDLDIGVNTHSGDTYRQGMAYGRKYFLGNFDRLVKVKNAVDPDNFFRNEQSIPTSG